MSKRIMYVEDEIDTLNVVKLILQKEGFDVVGAANGKEALDNLTKFKLDLVLLDIMLPDMSGWDVFRKIREIDSKLKVAFISAIPISVERAYMLKESGVAGYITKPFDKDELVKHIRRVI